VKITKAQLNSIIQEELAGVLGEISTFTGPYDANPHWISTTPSGKWWEYELPGGDEKADTLADDPNRSGQQAGIDYSAQRHEDPTSPLLGGTEPAMERGGPSMAGQYETGGKFGHYWYDPDRDEVFQGEHGGVKQAIGDPNLAPVYTDTEAVAGTDTDITPDVDWQTTPKLDTMVGGKTGPFAGGAKQGIAEQLKQMVREELKNLLESKK
tara:strand:+ start:48 stop:677 length:630 start_codon:yes stop_codon:yes gene_type:complete